MKDLYNYIGFMIQNGILYEDKVIPFSILDYYCITKEDIYKIIGKVKMNYRGYQYYGDLVNFAQRNNLLVREIDDISEIVDEHNAFITNDKRFEPTIYDIQNIYDLFEKYNIPKYSKLFYIALRRMALNIPILPLFEEKEKSKTR